MVNSINPGATSVGALGADQRYTRTTTNTSQQNLARSAVNDTVDLGDAAQWSAARESVRNGLAQVHQALAIGTEAQATLLQVRELATSGDADAKEKLATLLATFAAKVQSAIGDGSTLINGGSLSIQAEPGAAPVEIDGVDLSLKADPDADDVMQVSSNAQIDDDGLAQAAQTSLERLQEAMQRLLDAARSLEAHSGFLGAVEGAVGSNVRTDLDADSARLLALQVRQGLDGLAGKAIANVEPQAVLTLFRT